MTQTNKRVAALSATLIGLGIMSVLHSLPSLEKIHSELKHHVEQGSSRKKLKAALTEKFQATFAPDQDDPHKLIVFWEPPLSGILYLSTTYIFTITLKQDRVVGWSEDKAIAAF